MSAPWRRAALEGAPLAAFLLGITLYWYACANRYIVFLYEHRGAQPFDALTGSRYAMAGLVAGGALLCIWTARCLLGGHLGRLGGRAWEPPAWWRLWALYAIPVGAGVYAITRHAGAPVLPPPLAAAAAVATAIGFAGALLPGRQAAVDPGALLWLGADGAALVPPLLLLRAASPQGGALLSGGTGTRVALFSLMAAGAWLAVMTALCVWRHCRAPSALALWLAGLSEAYMLGPLLHYVLSDPGGPYYITAASNFVAPSLYLQAVVLLVAGGLAWLATAMRRRLSVPS